MGLQRCAATATRVLGGYPELARAQAPTAKVAGAPPAWPGLPLLLIGRAALLAVGPGAGAPQALSHAPPQVVGKDPHVGSTLDCSPTHSAACMAQPVTVAGQKRQSVKASACGPNTILQSLTQCRLQRPAWRCSWSKAARCWLLGRAPVYLVQSYKAVGGGETQAPHLSPCPWTHSPTHVM